MEKSIENYIEEVKRLKQTYGNQHFRKSGLHAVLNDLSPGIDKKFLNVLKKADDLSLCIKISHLEKENESIKAIELAKYRQDFVQNSGLDNMLATLIFDTYLFGLDLCLGFKYDASAYSIKQASNNNLVKYINDLSGFDTVKIENQIWSSKNMSIKKFLNGDPIPNAKSSDDWIKAGLEQKPVYCAYENDENYENQFGLMYNWWAINDPRGLIHKDFRIPSRDDFEVLKKSVSKNGNLLKSKICKNGLDSFGLSLMPGGFRSSKGKFGEKGNGFYYWSKSSGGGFTGKAGYYLRLYEHISSFSVYSENKAIGMYVRILKDI